MTRIPHPLPLLFAAAAVTMACGPERPEDGAPAGDAVTVEATGDTTLVTNPAGLAVPVDTVREVVTVWRDAALERPTVLTVAGDLLVVGDQVRLHLVSPAGDVRTVGRRGEGPGELGWIAQLAMRNDTIVVLDGRLLRHSLFDVEGAYLDSHPVTWPAPWVNPPRSGEAVALRGDSLVRVATENVSTTRPVRLQLEREEVPPLHPSFDHMVFGIDGSLWVRTIGTETPDVHPTILSRRPELLPPLRAWDRFGRDGRLTRTVWLPTSFDPRVIDGDVIRGFSTLDTGEIGVARADLPSG